MGGWWSVPKSLIKKEKIDFENESLSFLGAGVAVGTKLIARPLTMGVMTMTEIMDNTLIKKMFVPDLKEEPTMFDLYAVYYLNHFRQEALEDVRAWYRRDKEPLKRKIVEWAENRTWYGRKRPIIHPHHDCYIAEMLHRSMEGFRMIPGAGGGGDMVYGAESKAFAASICCKKLNIDYDTLIWETPLTTIGHILAVNAVENGVKNVQRPYDEEHIKEIEKECAMRDTLGLLYPWQKQFPFREGIAYQQNECALCRWEKAAKAYIQKHGVSGACNDNIIKNTLIMYKSGRAEYLKQQEDMKNEA